MVDIGSGVTGAAAGAAAGSAMLPGVGTVLGGIGGGMLGLFGGKKKPKKRSTMNKRQRQLFDQYAEGLQGQGGFADLFSFDPEATRDVYNQMYAQPAYQQFQEEVVPGITGQFRGGNLANSSYMGGALAKAGTDVQKNLNAQLAQMLYQGQQSSIDRRLQGLQNILGMQTFAYEKPQASSFDQMLSGFGSGLGEYAGQKFGSWLKG
jgi:hypothetical protein